MKVRRIVAVVLATVLWIPGKVAAAEIDPVVEREITALFAVLETSGCEFDRNGRWHDGKAAAAHLRRKYDYARKRSRIPSTELFIERAASASSLSGRAYRVRCGDAAPVPSRTWFLARLDVLRGSSGKPRD